MERINLFLYKICLIAIYLHIKYSSVNQAERVLSSPAGVHCASCLLLLADFIIDGRVVMRCFCLLLVGCCTLVRVVCVCACVFFLRKLGNKKKWGYLREFLGLIVGFYFLRRLVFSPGTYLATLMIFDHVINLLCLNINPRNTWVYTFRQEPVDHLYTHSCE